MQSEHFLCVRLCAQSFTRVNTFRAHSSFTKLTLNLRAKKTDSNLRSHLDTIISGMLVTLRN